MTSFQIASLPNRGRRPCHLPNVANLWWDPEIVIVTGFCWEDVVPGHLNYWPDFGARIGIDRNAPVLNLMILF